MTEKEIKRETALEHILNQYLEQVFANKIKIEEESILNEILKNKASLREIVDTKPLREIFQNKELFEPGKMYTLDEIKTIVGKASKNRYPDSLIQRHVLYHSFNEEFLPFIDIFIYLNGKYWVFKDSDIKNMFTKIILNDHFWGTPAIQEEEYDT